MRINYNVQAMNANLALNRADGKVSQSIRKLSSGLKVSEAKDNPSGYAMSKRMNMQIEGISRATQSSNDAINIISIADGALQEVSDMVQRMSELATRCASDTMTDSDRKLCQDEVAQLKKEIQRVASTTEFNGQTLLDGSFDLKGYTDNLSMKVATYSDETPVGEYSVKQFSLVYDKDGNIDPDKTILQNDGLVGTALGGGEAWPDDAKITEVNGNMVTITGANHFSITFDVSGVLPDPKTPNGTSQTVALSKVQITGLGAMDMQIGANEDQILAIRIPELSLKLMGIEDLDLGPDNDKYPSMSAQERSAKAMNDCKTALTYVNDIRSRLGAYQNRLEHTVAALNVTNEALTGAYSGLVDADMAEETVTYSTQQIISQAATSVLAQANDRPSQALQLLQ
jgi:flagellin